jgi:Na+-translocating ferredoxin:NAD+ oxidoreductase RnfC subunit
MKMEISELIFNAGVVGAGGAGFPTHIKAKSKVEYVLANGAECEPLIHKDYELMVNFPENIVEGMNSMIQASSAKKGYFGIKEKNAKAIESISSKISDTNIELSLLGDFYPSGDEYELVYHTTKRLIPPHGIPLQVGCLVNNVETLFNINNAINGKPVTQKFVSVAGMVNHPSSFFIPVGTSFKELIEIAGGAKIREFGIFVSGIMMGQLTFDINEVVKKTTAGIIILPVDHYLINRNNRNIQSKNRIGKSACDQCSYCTEFCPRYLLGYDVQPHKVMRSLGFSASGSNYWNQYADLCCSCGLCSLYACPEDLYPREACDQSKIEMKKNNFRYEQTKELKVHPIKEGRRVPLKQLMKKLDISKYDVKTPFHKFEREISEVKIYLKQHAGNPAYPVVNKSDKVEEGQLIADIDENKLGAKIHASISGIVKEVNTDFIIISKS